MTPVEEIAALRAEYVTLREHVTVLVSRIHELEARLAKDSPNSSNLFEPSCSTKAPC